MSKSILVIDTPSVCIDCPCHFTYDTGTVVCGVNGNEISSDDIETFKPYWCPIKEIPQKYEPVSMNFEIGWNACLDEMFGKN